MLPKNPESSLCQQTGERVALAIYQHGLLYSRCAEAVGNSYGRYAVRQTAHRPHLAAGRLEHCASSRQAFVNTQLALAGTAPHLMRMVLHSE